MGRYRDDEPPASDVVLWEIRTAGEKGIIQKELLSRVRRRVHRATVSRVAKKYEKEKKIRILREGNTVRYIPIEKTPLDAGLGAFMLSSQAASKLLEFPHIYGRNEPGDSTKTDDYSFEKALKEFSTIVGAIITYFLIHASITTNILLLSKDQKEEIDMNLVREWINNAISPYLVSRIYWQFQLLIGGSISRQQEISRNFERSLADKNIATKLTGAFAKVFPTISKDLDDIMKNILKKGSK